MEKEKLKKTRKLRATPSMMGKALYQTKRTQSTNWRNVNTYEIGIFLRAQNVGGILKVAIYEVEKMKLGAAEPTYEVYLNPEGEEFITWDTINQRWSNAKLDMLVWPDYYYGSGKWINPDGKKNIQTMLKVKAGGFEGVMEFQLRCRANQLITKYKRETNPWDMKMEQIKPLPKDWERWASKVGVTENYIFYEYERKGAIKGYCSFCEKMVPIKKPKHNATGKCKCCGKAITFKSLGKMGRFHTKNNIMYLIQAADSEFVIRRFGCTKGYDKSTYKNPYINIEEYQRSFFDENFLEEKYVWEIYKAKEFRWVRERDTNDYNWYYYNRNDGWLGKIYKRNIPSLAKKEIKPTMLKEMIDKIDLFDPIRYMRKIKNIPYIEKAVKVGLDRLVDNLTNESGKRGFDPINYRLNESELAKILRIDTMRLKRMASNDGGTIFLQYLQHEKSINTIIKDETIAFFEENEITVKEMDFIADRMSLTQIHNYIKRQAELGNQTPRETLETWKDYLAMAKAAKLDTKDAIIYRATKLKHRHDELILKKAAKDIKKEAEMMLKTYPLVDKNCGELKKYEWSNGEYSVIAPTSAEEILVEGKILNLCFVARGDRYFDRINRKEAFLLFLRKTESVECSWYTIEIEPGGTIRQKRTFFDRQLKDLEEAVPFLKEWQKVIQKRLTIEDKKLAKMAKKEREKNFEELRESKKVVYQGEFQGVTLIDLLERDLMEA